MFLAESRTCAQPLPTKPPMTNSAAADRKTRKRRANAFSDLARRSRSSERSFARYASTSQGQSLLIDLVIELRPSLASSLLEILCRVADFGASFGHVIDPLRRIFTWISFQMIEVDLLLVEFLRGLRDRRLLVYPDRPELLETLHADFCGSAYNHLNLRSTQANTPRIAIQAAGEPGAV
jgi:hypothetical protein